MALVEKFPRRIIEAAGSKTGFREFLCEWQERETVKPRVGDQWPDDETLFVEHVESDQTGRPDNDVDDPDNPTMCDLHVRYSTRNPYLPVWTTDISAEFLETSAFRMWTLAGTLSTMRMSLPYAVAAHTCELVTWIDPRGMAWQLRNMVNNFPFEGFDRGCVLYLGAKVQSESTNLYERCWRARHLFLVRDWDWNWQWREAQQARDVLGRLRWDPDTGEPIMVDGIAGTSDWDVLNPLLYPYANFEQLYVVR